MPASPKTSSSPRDWRSQSRAKPRSTGGKYASRVFLTLLAGGLAGALVYLLYHLVPPGVHFAVLPVSDSDVLMLPPIPYSRENVDSLRDLAMQPPVLDLHDIQTANAMGTLAGKLREGLQKSDTLIVYLTGNCVSDVGPDGPAAWLLCSDFSVFHETGGTESKPAGRYRLRDLLGQIKQCPAKSKLLVLETGYLNYDPRMGLFVNEFPRLLEEDVKAVNDPDLWVLCSCRPLESSHVCGPAKRSVFSYFINQGITGAAKHGNRWVELEDLFTYVRDHVASWVDLQSGGAETQTPWLLHCGDVDKPPKGFRLVPVLSRKPPPKPAEGDAAAEAASPKPAKPTPAELLSAALTDAWQRRDRLEDRMLSRGGWTPADYAPHLWREYQELLLGIDRRSRAGAGFVPTSLTNEISQDLDLDEKLFLDASSVSPAVAAAAASAVRTQNVASRLMAARAQFIERTQGDSYFADGNPLRTAIQFKNDLTQRAVYYVRWNTAAWRSSLGHGPLDLELAKMLPMLAGLIGSLEQAQTASTPAPSAAVPQEIADSVAAIKDSQRVIEQIIDDKIKAWEQHPEAAAIAALLDTPLPTAGARKRLIAARDRAAEKLPGDAPQKPAAATAPVLWTSNIRLDADLEKQLVMLANPDFHSASIETADGGGTIAPAPADDRFWHTYRQFGQELGGFYRGLPESIRKEIASGDSSAANRCDRYLRMVDARDAKNVPEEVLALLLPHRHAAPVPSLAVRAESPPAADADGQYLIKLVIDKQDMPATAGRISFEHQGDIVLATADGKQTILPDEPFSVELSSDHTERLFKARAQVQTGAETTLAITVRCGEKTRQCSVRFALPQQDVVLVRAYRLAGKLDGSTEPRQECENVLQFDRLVPQRLEPFPNRPTTYTFEMVNRSGLGKKLLVRTYALPEWFWNRNMNCRQACDVLSQSPALLLGESPVELAEIGKTQKLAFPAIKPPPAPVPPPTPTPTAAAPSPPKPKVDVSAGLALVVCDAKTKEPEPKWLQLYSFTPLRPARYLEPTIRYDSGEGQLNIDVALSAERDIPPCSKTTPIRLIMDVRDSAGRAVNLQSPAGAGLHGQTKALLYPALPRDVLYAPVRSDGREALQVELSVDDYPRAFLFEVGLNKAAPQRDLWRIRIIEPPHDPVSCFQPREMLPVKFRVDAPEDSFIFRGTHGPADDAVHLEIFDEQHPEAVRPQTFYSDRKVTVELGEADAAGEMKATTKVEDFSTEVDSHGLENVVARVHAQLLRDRQSKDEDSLRVILDGRPPEFDLELGSGRVVKGTDIRVTATVVRTLSDMVKFDYGFQGDVEKQFKDKSKKIDVHGLTASFSLPTKELDAGEYTVLVRGENKAGNFDFRTVKVDVVEPPPPMPDKPAAPATITVRGAVRWGDDSPASGVKVSIEQPARSATTDGAGKFSFADLPRGSYKLKAEGSTGGIHASGEAEADPGGGAVADVKIKLSSLKR